VLLSKREGIVLRLEKRWDGVVEREEIERKVRASWTERKGRDSGGRSLS
jgi:hypothetical protein